MMTTTQPRWKRSKPVIGLIGGMGSGKSRVADEFARRGAYVISGDALGHEGLRQPEVRGQVVARWGPDILGPDGEIDRRRVAAIVFVRPDERKALESLLHPWIEKRVQEEIQNAEKVPSCRLIVLDAAVLLEAGWDGVCDRLVFVQAPEDVRRRRLAEQRGWSTKEVTARESAQLSLTEKASRAHDVLDNSGSLEQLATQVEALLRRWNLLP